MPGCDGTPIAWTIDGPPGADPVVLCNGIACSDAYWYAVAPALSRAHRVVRWDYRGHGRSGDPVDRSRTDVAASAADLLAVLDAAGLDRAVIVGHSYGVQVALELYGQAPDRVAALVAVAGAPPAPGPTRTADTWEAVLLAVRAMLTTSPKTARRTWDRVWDSPGVYQVARLIGGTTTAAPMPVMRSYFTHVRERDPALLLDMLRGMQAYDAAPVIGQLAVPLLALAGDRDRLTPVEALRHLALTAPQGELAVRHGAAHTLPAEHPAWVSGEILRFLDRVPESGDPAADGPVADSMWIRRG